MAVAGASQTSIDSNTMSAPEETTPDRKRNRKSQSSSNTSSVGRPPTKKVNTSGEEEATPSTAQHIPTSRRLEETGKSSSSHDDPSQDNDINSDSSSDSDSASDPWSSLARWKRRPSHCATAPEQQEQQQQKANSEAASPLPKDYPAMPPPDFSQVYEIPDRIKAQLMQDFSSEDNAAYYRTHKRIRRRLWEKTREVVKARGMSREMWEGGCFVNMWHDAEVLGTLRRHKWS